MSLQHSHVPFYTLKSSRTTVQTIRRKALRTSSLRVATLWRLSARKLTSRVQPAECWWAVHWTSRACTVRLQRASGALPPPSATVRWLIVIIWASPAITKQAIQCNAPVALCCSEHINFDDHHDGHHDNGVGSALVDLDHCGRHVPNLLGLHQLALRASPLCVLLARRSPRSLWRSWQLLGAFNAASHQTAQRRVRLLYQVLRTPTAYTAYLLCKELYYLCNIRTTLFSPLQYQFLHNMVDIIGLSKTFIQKSICTSIFVHTRTFDQIG